MNAKFVKRPHKRAREEIKIFENSKNSEIQDERKDKPFFPIQVRASGCDLLGDQEIYCSAANHESEETPIPPSIKKVAGHEKENILGAVLETPVQQRNWYQKQKVSRGVKEHDVKLTHGWKGFP